MRSLDSAEKIRRQVFYCPRLQRIVFSLLYPIMVRFREKVFLWERQAKNAFTWNAENFLAKKIENKSSYSLLFFMTMVLSLVDNIDIKKSIRKHKSRRGGMVDTTDSKSVARKGVRVQVSLPAFFISKQNIQTAFVFSISNSLI